MNLPFIIALLATAALSSSTVIKSPETGAIPPNFELLILHNNDMHARFEQTSQLSGVCTTADREAGKCYGGFPRVATVVKEARRKAASGEGPPVLYLNAGDTYTGTAWFTIYKWKIAAEFINALRPDAVSLGNHEFDETVDGLVPFIKNISSPVVAANLILDDVPELQEVNNLYESIVLEKKGVKIGIIGYLTPETSFLAPKNKVQIQEEIQAIQKEVRKLKKQGIKILIALGHSGFVKDLAIAKRVEDLDLVIGGHSNTFLWNGGLTEKPEIREGPYPTVVTDPNGRKVLVVQAYAYTKYMGRLHLTFNSNGEVTEYDGLPILLNNSIPEDPEVLNIVNRYRESVYKISNEVAGISNVTLDGNCRLKECNLGDIITDILINYTKRHYSEEYPDVHIAICQGGRIRVSIDYPQKPFNTTKGDWINVLPFTDTMTIVSMNGSILRRALEHSVAVWRPIDSVGQFLQFSGMKVTYDLLKPAGSRIIKAHAICSNCGNTELAEIEDKYTYRLLMPSFLAEGGDGFSIFSALPQEPVPYNELTCIYEHLKEFGAISPEVSDRITLLNEKEAIAKFMTSYSKNVILQPSRGHSIHSGLYITYVAILFLCKLLSR
ncbi:protein 5NUC-like isoform X4 [Leguminivora glycinivorella]|nr:protein 5NUC-like isoform X4 [Leguminivora glycinivorella]